MPGETTQFAWVAQVWRFSRPGALQQWPSLLDEARKAAEAEGVALNQLINVAVAEKLSAFRTEEYFRQRASYNYPRKHLCGAHKMW